MADESVSVKLEADSKSFVQAFNEASEAVNHTVSAGKGMVSAYHGIQNQIKKIVGGIVDEYKKLALVGAGAIIGTGAQAAIAVKAYSSVENALANVNTVMDSTKGSVAGMRDALSKMSGEFPQTIEELAAGLYDVNSAGFQGEEGLKVLRAAAQFSVAGLTDMSTTVRATTGIMLAYNLSAEEAAHVTDVLFKAVEIGQMTAQEFAMNIGDWASSASSLKVPFESASAALAVMTTRGAMPANLAATSLNSIFRALIRPSEQMARALKRLGYESGKAALNAEGFAGTLGMLWEASGKNETKFAEMFQDVEGFRGALGLVTVGYTDLLKAQQDFNNSAYTQGTASRAFQKQVDTISNQSKIFRNELRQNTVLMGSLVAPVVKTFLGLGTAVLKFWNDQPVAVRATGAALQLLAPALITVGGFFAVLHFKELLVVKSTMRVAQAFQGMAATFSTMGRMGAANSLGSVAVFFRRMADAGGPMKMLNNKIRDFILATQAQKIAMLRVAAASMVWIGVFAAAAIGLWELNSAMDEGRRKAEELKATFAKVGNSGINSVKKLNEEYQRAIMLQQEYLDKTGGGSIGNSLLAGLQMVTPFTDNTKWDAVQQAAGAAEMAQSYIDLAGVVSKVAMETGYSNDQILAGLAQMSDEGIVDIDLLTKEYLKWLDLANDPRVKAFEDRKRLAAELDKKLGNEPGTTRVEPLDFMDAETAQAWDFLSKLMASTTEQAAEYAKKQAAVKAANEATSTSQQKLALAMADYGDAALTATQKSEAYKQILDELLTGHMDILDAQAGMYDAIENLGQAMIDQGANFDLTTKGGRDLQQALSSAGQAAVEYGAAQEASSGGLITATKATALYVQGVIGMAKNAKWGEDQIAQLISTMGLTPEVLETLITLPGIDPAIAKLLQTAGILSYVDGYVATAHVNVVVTTSDSPEAYWGAQGNYMKGASSPEGTPTEIYAQKALNDIIKSFTNNLPGGSKSGGGGGGGGAAKWKPTATQLRNMAAALSQPLVNLLDGDLGAEYQRQIAQSFFDNATKNILLEGKTRLGASILREAQKTGEDPSEQIDTMVDAYNRLTLAAGRAAADIAVNQFTTLEAFTKYVEAIEAMVEHQQAVEDWKFSKDQINTDQYLEILRTRLEKYQEYSDEWMSITDQIAQVEADRTAEDYRMAQVRLAIGEMTNEQYKAFLMEQLYSAQMYSQEWFSLWQEINDLNKTQEQELNDAKQTVTDFAESVKNAFEDIRKSVEDPILKATSLISAFGDQASVTQNQVQGFYEHMLAGTQRWVATIRALKDKGINGAFLTELIQAGPQSLGFAESILALGDSGISFINDSYRQIADMASGLGTDIAMGSVGTLNQVDNSVSISVGNVTITADMPDGVTIGAVNDAIRSALNSVAADIANRQPLPSGVK